MEAAAGVIAAGRGISLPINSSQTSRKEWRVVSEQSVRNSSNEVFFIFEKPVCITCVFIYFLSYNFNDDK